MSKGNLSKQEMVIVALSNAMMKVNPRYLVLAMLISADRAIHGPKGCGDDDEAKMGVVCNCASLVQKMIDDDLDKAKPGYEEPDVDKADGVTKERLAEVMEALLARAKAATAKVHDGKEGA